MHHDRFDEAEALMNRHTHLLKKQGALAAKDLAPQFCSTLGRFVICDVLRGRRAIVLERPNGIAEGQLTANANHCVMVSQK